MFTHLDVSVTRMCLHICPALHVIVTWRGDLVMFLCPAQQGLVVDRGCLRAQATAKFHHVFLQWHA